MSLADAMPRRPVAVTPPRPVGPLGSLGALALLLALMAGLVWWLGPDLARDWRIASSATEAADIHLESPRCTSRLVVLNLCDVTLLDERSAPAGKRTIWYAFIGTGAAESLAAIKPVRSAADPARVSTTLGLERRLQRSLTLALALALIAACSAAVARMIQQGLHNLGALRSLSGQRLIPVVVDIERSNLVPPRRRLWVYLYDDGGRRGRAFIELAKKDRPLFTDASEKRALAVQGEGGGMPLLLDQRLAWLDLTGPEKEAFYAACRAAFPLPGAGASR
jgi:hypothetical protein